MITAEGLSVTAESAELEGTDTIISFDNFVVPISDTMVDAKIVADIKGYSTAGNTDVVNLGSITATLLSVVDSEKTDGEYDNFKGADSKENLSVVDIESNATDTVTISPVLVTVTLDRGRQFDEWEERAGIKFIIDKGTNSLKDKRISLNTIKFSTGSNISTAFSGANVTLKIDGTKVAYTISGNTVKFTGGAKIKSSNVLEFTLDFNVAHNRMEILKGGIDFIVDTKHYAAINDNNNNIDLGAYKK